MNTDRSSGRSLVFHSSKGTTRYLLKTDCSSQKSLLHCFHNICKRTALWAWNCSNRCTPHELNIINDRTALSQLVGRSKTGYIESIRCAEKLAFSWKSIEAELSYKIP